MRKSILNENLRIILLNSQNVWDTLKNCDLKKFVYKNKTNEIKLQLCLDSFHFKYKTN